MKTIGLLGGMSWESSIEYYRLINQLVKSRLGGLSSAQCLLYSVNFQQIKNYQQAGDWSAATKILINAAQKLEAGGAEFILICTNTMHLMADEVAASISVPLLHIADSTAEEIKKCGFKNIGLLGTKYTMEQDFYKGRLVADHGLNVIVPNEQERSSIHNIIYDELCLGKTEEKSRAEYIRIISSLAKSGAEAIILGCTEIGLLISEEMLDIPIFDTAIIHAEHAVNWSLDP